MKITTCSSSGAEMAILIRGGLLSASGVHLRVRGFQADPLRSEADSRTGPLKGSAGQQFRGVRVSNLPTTK